MKEDSHSDDTIESLHQIAHELASNPDSPASLSIRSGMNALMRHRARAIDQLVGALADQMDRPCVASDAAVAAAAKQWEVLCHGPLDPDRLAKFQKDAAELRERRRRQPPSLESIVQGVNGRSDVGHDMGLHLEGLHGTWHRLWASITVAKLWTDIPECRESVSIVRAQFEKVLGRTLSAEEWSNLETHAHHHAETVMKATFDKGVGTES